MRQIYIKPDIKVRKIDVENALLDDSLNSSSPTSGLGEDAPTSGGTANGGSAGDASAKFNAWNTWGDEDE